ncbi:uncharacterized protein LOC143080916 [Mytilus galloprovincialis]|uniref:uncharacterized protein LOC143080916 n=1 Tax=Mytilus galloprovincialis TaxID=29158 RepID=UPI003F7B426B
MIFGTKGIRGFPYLLLLFTFLYLSQCKNRNKVSLSWKSDGNHLCLFCDVKNLSLGVTFEDPTGHSRGHCTAPIPHTAPGHCDLKLAQNIYNETTVLTVDKKDNANGVWKCFHGENTNEYATTSVLIDSTKKDPKRTDYSNGYKCAFLSLCGGYCVALFMQMLFILVFSILGKAQRYTDNCKYQRHTDNTMLYYLLVFLPFVVIGILTMPLGLIPGICEGSWWILICFIGIIVTSIFKVAIVCKEMRNSLNFSISSESG